MVWFGLIWILGPLLSEPISNVESGMSPDHSIWFSDIGSMLPDLVDTYFT